jgi:hypothetical protein
MQESEDHDTHFICLSGKQQLPKGDEELLKRKKGIAVYK